MIVTNIWKILVSKEVFSEKFAKAFDAYEMQLHKTIVDPLFDIQLGVLNSLIKTTRKHVSIFKNDNIIKLWPCYKELQKTH